MEKGERKNKKVTEPDVEYGHYSYADYLTWQMEEMVELIKGKVFKKAAAAPSRIHQKISYELAYLLTDNLKNHHCEVYSAPFDVRLPQQSKADKDIFTVVQPDLCVICDREKLDNRGCIGAPDLVVEILSPGNNRLELQHKYELYQERALKNTLEKAPFGEWKAIYNVLNHLPETSKLHLANSMAVRYVNFLGARKQEIICNRGTSGIDGSNSTAVGCTFTTKEFVTLITGDMAFFYDRNAFWHNYTTNNLRIILLNNHAGGIFRIINGPNKQPELEEFFETKQSLNAAHLAMDFGFGYLPVKSEEELDAALMDFYHPSVKPKIIEVFSDSAENTAILNTIKSNLRNFMDQ